jgi:hypothetical protein
MIATVSEGHADLADVLFLVAFILFVIVCVMRVLAHGVDGAIIAAGFAVLALAWLVL